MYKYHGFGLSIASEIEFPELLPADFANADVTIALGKTPDKLETGDIITTAFSGINSHEYLLNIKDTCRYYASNGCSIIAEPDAGMDDHSIRLFLLGTIMAAILYQRGNIPFHASAIVKDGKLTLFAGDSGAGKSTLLAALATKGHTIFTDDICVLQYNASQDKDVLGTASYPMIKLWEDAIGQLDSNKYTRDFKIRPQMTKYGQFFYESFNTQSLPVDKIFVLSPQSSAKEITIKKLDPIPAFKQLEKQAYKYELIAHTQLRSMLFTVLSRLAIQADVLEVIRPTDASAVATLADAIEKLF